MRKSISADVAAALLKLTPQRVRVLCRQRRIPGARRIGRDWLLPEKLEVVPPRRGPQRTYREREMANSPIRMPLGDDFEIEMFISENATRLVVQKIKKGDLSKTQLASLIGILEILRDQMV